MSDSGTFLCESATPLLNLPGTLGWLYEKDRLTIDVIIGDLPGNGQGEVHGDASNHSVRPASDKADGSGKSGRGAMLLTVWSKGRRLEVGGLGVFVLALLGALAQVVGQ